MFHRLCTVLMLAAAAWGLPANASAQALGLGPRFAFVRGDLGTGTPSTSFFGGTLRMATSKRVILEAALDYRTELSDDGATRLRETPLQGSLLLFPVRARFAPYVLGGFGVYSQTTEHLDLEGGVVETTKAKKTGWHLGLGAELFLSRKAALFADYRFRFVKFGDPEPGAEPINLPGLDNKLSHQGSMWTSGMAFYF